MLPAISDVMPKQGSLTERTVSAARQVLAGQRGGLHAYLTFAGPAVIASIAYMDPGNFATNIQAGARYGYGLLWVVLLANLIAMLSRPFPPSSASSPDETWQRCAASTFRVRSSGRCGSSARSLPWRPT
jgi:hypothetical protein